MQNDDTKILITQSSTRVYFRRHRQTPASAVRYFFSFFYIIRRLHHSTDGILLCYTERKYVDAISWLRSCLFDGPQTDCRTHMASHLRFHYLRLLILPVTAEPESVRNDIIAMNRLEFYDRTFDRPIASFKTTFFPLADFCPPPLSEIYFIQLFHYLLRLSLSVGVLCRTLFVCLSLELVKTLLVDFMYSLENG